MTPVLVIHGGAGRRSPSQKTPEALAPYQAELRDSIAAGMAVLEAGGAAVDAVVAAVAVLEDAPLYNAGQGSALCRDGSVECCASIMCGTTGRAGAACLLTTIKNPVRLARHVLDHEHTLIAGESAERLAETAALERTAPEAFITEARRAQWERIRHLDKTVLDPTSFEPGVESKGTVGAVALDVQGHLAAATSTGGLVNQLPGRIGDSPVVGAGTWADERIALSATGDGDVFARLAFARRVADLVELAGMDPLEAALQTLKDVDAGGGEGGCIMVSRDGTVYAPHNSPDMFWMASNA